MPSIRIWQNLRETWKQVVGPLSKLVIDFKEVASLPMLPKKISESSGRPNKATIVRVIWFWNFRTVYYPTVTLKQRTNQPDTLDICVTRPTSATSLTINDHETNKYLSYLQHCQLLQLSKLPLYMFVSWPCRPTSQLRGTFDV